MEAVTTRRDRLESLDEGSMRDFAFRFKKNLGCGAETFLAAVECPPGSGSSTSGIPYPEDEDTMGKHNAVTLAKFDRPLWVPAVTINSSIVLLNYEHLVVTHLCASHSPHTKSVALSR